MVQPDPVCAYCRRRPVEPEWRPFCSERCKLVDLGAWFANAHGIAGEPVDETTGDPSPGADPPA